MREFEIAALYPRHLNLNGDLANAGVLAKRLGWYGYGSNVSLVDLKDAAPDRVDLVVLGHGSPGAWSEILEDGSEALAWLERAIESGVLVIAIGSGFEHLAASGFFGEQLRIAGASRGVRRSEFAAATTRVFGEELEVLGYVNSDSGLPLIANSNRLIGSLLHGPLLAKNPKLADAIIEQLIEGQPSAQSETSAGVLSRIDSVVNEIWKLEKPD